jgi:division/cell wall cluster transcriptional repressor MraZ
LSESSSNTAFRNLSSRFLPIVQALDGLYGAYHPSMDARGRFQVPQRVRQQLIELASEGLWITADLQGFLRLYPAAAMARFLESVAAWPESRTWERRVIETNRDRIEIDPTGRMQISEALRAEAGLKAGEFRLAGAGDYFEIWDMERYREQQSLARSHIIRKATEGLLGS